ncbi:hypothetical protein THIOSC15_2300014 [uncultured Thiomicrorhabdus sp.]
MHPTRRKRPERVTLFERISNNAEAKIAFALRVVLKILSFCVAYRLFGLTTKTSGTLLNVSLEEVKRMDVLYKSHSERLDC